MAADGRKRKRSRAETLARSRRCRGEIKSSVPLLRDFFRDVLDPLDLTLEEVTRRAGLADNSLSLYRSGKSIPRLDMMIALVNAVGYELKIVKKDEGDGNEKA
jgi:hypothetical protein